MANPEQLALLKKSVSEWNRFREDFPRVVPDLREASLTWADLIGANLDASDLRIANLSKAQLAGTGLAGANLTSAKLDGAYLCQTNFCGAIIGGATASLAIAIRTVFADVDLSGVQGLKTVVHMGPSAIGIDTILRSGGKIPDEFLRGCGVDPLIQKMLVGDGHSKSDAFTEWVSKGHNPLQRCFISYATEDKAFVDRLQKELNQRGVNYWYAPEHGRWGEELQWQIDLEISLRDRMLLVCSKISLTKDWVRHEIDEGIEQERKRGARVIFPIMIDDGLLAWKDRRAGHILEVLAADFRKATKGQAFEKQLPRLLKALGYPS